MESKCDMSGKEKHHSADKLAEPDWFQNINLETCICMDVRPVLAAGIDPLEEILKRVEQLSSEDVIMIEAPFDPVPLRRLMASRKYDSHGVMLAENYWQIFFAQQGGGEIPEFPDLPPFPVTRTNGVLELDLRGMVPPNPMIAILKAIEQGTEMNEFIVRLDRDPIYLHAELVERKWQANVTEEKGDGLIVRIKKVKPGKGI